MSQVGWIYDRVNDIEKMIKPICTDEDELAKIMLILKTYFYRSHDWDCEPIEEEIKEKYGLEEWEY